MGDLVIAKRQTGCVRYWIQASVEDGTVFSYVQGSGDYSPYLSLALLGMWPFYSERAAWRKAWQMAWRARQNCGCEECAA